MNTNSPTGRNEMTLRDVLRTALSPRAEEANGKVYVDVDYSMLEIRLATQFFMEHLRDILGPHGVLHIQREHVKLVDKNSMTLTGSTLEDVLSRHKAISDAMRRT